MTLPDPSASLPHDIEALIRDYLRPIVNTRAERLRAANKERLIRDLVDQIEDERLTLSMAGGASDV